MIWSASFLKNIAEQNYGKYKESFGKTLQTNMDNVELDAPIGKVLFKVICKRKISLLLKRRSMILEDYKFQFQYIVVFTFLFLMFSSTFKFVQSLQLDFFGLDAFFKLSFLCFCRQFW